MQKRRSAPIAIGIALLSFFVASSCQNPFESAGDGSAASRVVISGTTRIEAESYTAMSGVQLEGSSEGGQNVGWIDTGDWMVYPITINTAGSYKIEYRVASPNNGGVLSADLNAGSTVLGQVNVPNTGGWQNWQTVSHNVNLSTGTFNLGLFAQTGGWNINWIQISPNSANNGIVSGQTYRLMAQVSGKALDVSEVSTADGANVHQWTYVGGNNQKWRIDDVGGGYYRLTAVHSNKVLEVAGASASSGANVQQWTWNNGGHQKWQIVATGGGYYKLVTQNSGKVLDVSNSSLVDGGNVQVWNNNDTSAQRWQIIQVTTDNPNDPNYPEPLPGQMVIGLQNNTNGRWTDSQIYVAVIGRHPATQRFNWLNTQGQLIEARVADNDAPNHLTKNGQNYSNYFMTLAQAKTLHFPKMDSGRMFISLGSPMYIKINTDANGNIGFAGPNLANPTDPNTDVMFEWVEFTFNNIGYFGNTTQVDQFAFPMTMELIAENGAYRRKVGITESRASIFSAYRNETPAEFRQLARSNASGDQRIIAPGKGGFEPGGPYANYFNSYVDQIWSYYTGRTITFSMWEGSRTFNGTVVGGQFRFEEVGVPGVYYYITRKPTTIEILEGSGVLATGNPTELAIQAQFCAAFNRHVMDSAAKWTQPSQYYSAAPSNYYAAFWHRHSIGGFAYGFAYDDVADQSTLVQRANPKYLTVGIGW